MSSAQIALIDRLYREFYNQRDLGLAAQAARSIFHDPQRFIDEYKALRTAFPDLQVTRDRTLHNGNFVAVRWALRGTHEGELVLPYVTVPPTGLAITTLGISIFEVFRGQIISRVWASSDGLDMLHDLGVQFIPPSPP